MDLKLIDMLVWMNGVAIDGSTTHEREASHKKAIKQTSNAIKMYLKEQKL